jgi:hypothetical protein
VVKRKGIRLKSILHILMFVVISFWVWLFSSSLRRHSYIKGFEDGGDYVIELTEQYLEKLEEGEVENE